MTTRLTLIAAVLVLALAGYGFTQLPAVGAGGLLHPQRRIVTTMRPSSCTDVPFDGAGITLRGWRCRAAGPPKGVIVYLHGVADNRGSGAGIINRFVQRGYDVVAYDSRAHGESGGDYCTYGYFEKQDLRRVLDQLDAPRVILIGTSLGAAVALQEAAADPRVSAVVAAETFADLRTVATDRVPFFFTQGLIARGFDIAEARASFVADDVSPLAAATRITAPVLLIHGDADIDTPPEHSRRVFAALRAVKKLVLVPGAAHNQSLSGEAAWKEIDEWIEQ